MRCSLVAVFIQRNSGAYTSDLASHPDEPAHAVSGLMVHDYLRNLASPAATRWPLNPRTYAEVFYVHYPKVAIGHWPPLFYVTQAVWMFVFGRTKTALLLLMLAAMATASAVIFLMARNILGVIGGLLLAVVFLFVPISQQGLYAVMPEAFLALLSCWALMLGGEALAGKHKWLLFGAVGVCATLVHARGVALLLTVPIALVLGRQSGWLKRRSLWIGSVVVAAVVAVWLIPVNQVYAPTRALTEAAVLGFPVNLYHTLGPVLFRLTLIGAAFSGSYRDQPLIVFAVSIILGAWLFYSMALVPWEDRYLSTVLPACIILSAFGLKSIADRLSQTFPFPLPALRTAVAAIAAVGSIPYGLPLAHKVGLSGDAQAVQILSGPHRDQPVYLVAGDSAYEGALISSIAFRDPDHHHIVLRSSKELIHTNWSMSQLKAQFADAKSMSAYLDQSWISLALVEGGAVRPDVEMLREALGDAKWTPQPAPGGSTLYERSSPMPAGAMKVRVDMGHSLGKVLELDP